MSGHAAGSLRGQCTCSARHLCWPHGECACACAALGSGGLKKESGSLCSRMGTVCSTLADLGFMTVLKSASRSVSELPRMCTTWWPACGSGGVRVEVCACGVMGPRPELEPEPVACAAPVTEAEEAETAEAETARGSSRRPGVHGGSWTGCSEETGRRPPRDPAAGPPNFAPFFPSCPPQSFLVLGPASPGLASSRPAARLTLYSCLS